MSSRYGFQPKAASLAAIEVPTLVAWGSASHPAAQRANELIAECIDRARVAIIAGAAHFMISTHVEESARAIARHVGLSEYARTDVVSP